VRTNLPTGQQKVRLGETKCKNMTWNLKQKQRHNNMILRNKEATMGCTCREDGDYGECIRNFGEETSCKHKSRSSGLWRRVSYHKTTRRHIPEYLSVGGRNKLLYFLSIKCRVGVHVNVLCDHAFHASSFNVYFICLLGNDLASHVFVCNGLQVFYRFKNYVLEVCHLIRF
jgi:hypothetical protein